jgi:hypothetical protein
MSRAAVLVCLLLAACGSTDRTSPPPPPTQASQPKGVDGPADGPRRAKFLAGTSAGEARELVETNNPAHLDAVAAFFVDARKPYAERLVALAALHTLRSQDAGEYARLFPRLKPRLWEEVSHADGLDLSGDHEKGFIEAVGWLADQKDPAARLKMELHLDRETVKRKRLSDAALSAAALGLANYPGNESARDTLWAALKDPKETVTVRACCLKALKPFHPKDLESLVVQIPAAPGDDWLRDLQRRLR